MHDNFDTCQSFKFSQIRNLYHYSYKLCLLIEYCILHIADKRLSFKRLQKAEKALIVCIVILIWYY